MKSLKEALVHKHMDHYGSFKPGDIPEDGDIIVMTLEDTMNHKLDVKIGKYNAENKYIECIGTRIEYRKFQETLSYEYNEWVHRIAKIYRGTQSIRIIDIPKSNRYEYAGNFIKVMRFIKEIEKNPYYKLIYDDHKINKKFHL